MEVDSIDDVEEVLTKARALLETSWCRGSYEKIDGDGQHLFCSIGAIANVTTTRPRHLLFSNPDLYDRVVMALRETVGGSITNWNDRVGKEKVLEGFNQAIRDQMNKRMAVK